MKLVQEKGREEIESDGEKKKRRMVEWCEERDKETEMGRESPKGFSEWRWRVRGSSEGMKGGLKGWTWKEGGAIVRRKEGGEKEKRHGSHLSCVLERKGGEIIDVIGEREEEGLDYNVTDLNHLNQAT